MRTLALSLVFAASAGAQSVTGFVRDSAGRPLAGADVAIEALAKSTTTDASGRYRLSDIASGSRAVRARAVGHSASARIVQVGDGANPVDFVLERLPQQLDSVVVRDRSRIAGVGLAAFDDRRKLGFGKFIDAAELRANEHRSLADLMSSMQGVTLVKPRRCKSLRDPNEHCDSNALKRIAMRGRGQPCAMQVVLDGATVFRGDGRPVKDAEFDWEGAWDLNTTAVSELAGVEVYRSASEVPVEFGGSAAGCGVILLWTRR